MQYFANLHEKKITDKRKFWQTVKPFLSKKNKSREKNNRCKNEQIISDHVEVANILPEHFLLKHSKIFENSKNIY